MFREKSVYCDTTKPQAKRTAASSKLSKCAAAVRMAVSRGVSTFGQKTVLALVDHVTQVLPGPIDGFVQPLVQDYVKALVDMLSRPSHVELLARKDGAPWNRCVDFFLEVASTSLPVESQSSTASLNRSSLFPETFAPRTPKRLTLSYSQNNPSHTVGDYLRDSLEGLQQLFQASNAPIVPRSKPVTGIALRVLRTKNLSLGSMQSLCFSILNNIFSVFQASDIAFGLALTRDLLPLMGYWWRPEKISQDELIRALRNEISMSILLTKHHVEYLIAETTDDTLRNDVEELVDAMWLEYSKRAEPFRLQLDSLIFISAPGETERPAFQLLDTDQISHWTLIRNISLLEGILLLCPPGFPDSGASCGEKPQKKRRTRDGMARLKLKITFGDLETRRTGLQVIPFLVARGNLDPEELEELLRAVMHYTFDKNAAIASWALVASARYSEVHLPNS